MYSCIGDSLSIIGTDKSSPPSPSSLGLGASLTPNLHPSLIPPAAETPELANKLQYKTAFNPIPLRHENIIHSTTPARDTYHTRLTNETTSTSSASSTTRVQQRLLIFDRKLTDAVRFLFSLYSSIRSMPTS